MNKVELIGRLVKDPNVSVSASGVKVGRYTLAVDRPNSGTADFIQCVVFMGGADFVEKYLAKGMKIAIVGRIQTGSYEKGGHTVYTTDVVVESHEFCEKKSTAPLPQASVAPQSYYDKSNYTQQTQTTSEPDYDDLPF